ncbi:MAG: alkaline phosphatase family protein [Acidiferrobacterales bacterium]
MDVLGYRAAEQADQRIHLPDYARGSIVNLLSSIQAALGVQTSLYAPLSQLDPQRLARAQNLVLMVIDGLGYRYLEQQPEEAKLRRHVRARLTSVFPATTAAAVTTFFTGGAPQQHALTGWFTYFKEIGSVIAALPFRARYGGTSLQGAGVDAHALFDGSSLFERINAPAYIVLPQRIVDSDYTCAHDGGAERRAYSSLPEYFERLLEILRASGKRKYIYAYWPDFDSLAHHYGVDSPQVSAHFAELDAAFGEFFTAIEDSDTTVIVTADHGFIDSEPTSLIRLEDHPALAETLVLPLCGEPRVAFCYVRPNKCKQFEGYVRGELAQYMWLYRSTELIEQGFFGYGAPHPRLRDRIGDYTLIMKGNYVIKDWLFGERPYKHIGVHGGVSEQEMYVPLIVFES